MVAGVAYVHLLGLHCDGQLDVVVHGVAGGDGNARLLNRFKALGGNP